MSSISAPERLILALDMPEHVYALEIVDKYSDYINIFKVGLELFTSCGPRIVEDIKKKGKKVFLDLKFHDIPNTVNQAVLAAAGLGVSMLTLHTGGGLKMMSAAHNTSAAANAADMMSETLLPAFRKPISPPTSRKTM